DNPRTFEPDFINRFGFKLDFKVDDGHLNPSTNVVYELFQGGASLGITFVADQSLFNEDEFDEVLGLHFDSLGQFTASSAMTLNVRMEEREDGYVVGGPLRVVDVGTGAVIDRAYRILDHSTLALVDANGFEAVDTGAVLESGCTDCGTASEVWQPNLYDVGWVNLVYETGPGNMPLWESGVLRPVWRALFTDWLNGTEQFPDLGDAPSPDPNTDPSVTKNADPPGPYVTPFTPQPSTPAPAPSGAVNLVITDTTVLPTFKGTTVIASITGDGVGGPDSVEIVVQSATASITTLAVDLIGNAFTRLSGDFLADGFAAGQEITTSGFSLNNGRYTISSVNALSIVVAEALVFGDTSGSGDESLVSKGKLVFAGTGPFGGNGLVSIKAQAEEIEILPGVTISVRVVTGDPRTASSSGNSGNVELSAGTISLGREAAIVAHADGGFTGGDVKLIASSTGNTNFDFFSLSGPRATVDLGPSALITGANVLITATATTAGSASLGDVVEDLIEVLPASVGFFTALALIAANLDLLPQFIRDGFQVIADALTAAEDAFRDKLEDDELFELPAGVAAAAEFVVADAHVSVASGARISAMANATIQASATASLNVTTNAADGYLGLSYGNVRPTAKVRFAMGSKLLAGGNAELKSTTSSTLVMRTEVSNNGDAVGVSSSFGKTQALSRAEVAAGAEVEAANLTLFAENTRSIENKAIAGGFADSGTAGVGAVLAVGFYVSAAEVMLAATVTVPGAITLTARSIETKNDTQSFGSVSAQPGGSNGIENAAGQAAGDLDTSTNAGGRNVDPTNGSGDLTIGAAMTLIESENKAAAWIDDGAFITAGSMTITSFAEARP
ncbi:MAG TPA: hypothetical protein VE444_07960, partial [Gaiellaceae bacterium]|nr:hypothetical protein [Gaiellaceae bacterium]